MSTYLLLVAILVHEFMHCQYHTPNIMGAQFEDLLISYSHLHPTLVFMIIYHCNNFGTLGYNSSMQIAYQEK